MSVEMADGQIALKAFLSDWLACRSVLHVRNDLGQNESEHNKKLWLEIVSEF